MFALGTAGAAALAAILSGVTLSREPLWIDELLTVALAERSFGDWLHALPNRQNGLLFDAVLWPLVHIGGASAAVVRLPSLLAVVAAVVVCAFVGVRLAGRAVGLAAALLLAINPFSIAYAQEARPYGFVLLFSLLSVLLLLRALERPSRGRWLLYVLSIALLALSHDFAILSVIAHPALVVGSRRCATARYALLMGATAVVVAVLLALAVAHWGQSAFWWVSRPGRWLAVDVALTFAGNWPGIFICAAVLLGTAAIIVARRRAGRDVPFPLRVPVFLGIWLLVPFLILFGVSHYQPVLVSRYVLQSLPALCLGLALPFALIRTRLALVCCAAVVPAFLVATIHQDIKLTHDDWPGAATYLASAAGPDDRIVILGEVVSAADGLFYYSSAFGVTRDHLVWQQDEKTRLPSRFVAAHGFSDGSELLSVAKAGQPFWIVRSSVLSDKAAEALALVKKRCDVVADREFREVNVIDVASCPADLAR